MGFNSGFKGLTNSSQPYLTRLVLLPSFYDRTAQSWTVVKYGIIFAHSFYSYIMLGKGNWNLKVSAKIIVVDPNM